MTNRVAEGNLYIESLARTEYFEKRLREIEDKIGVETESMKSIYTQSPSKIDVMYASFGEKPEKPVNSLQVSKSSLKTHKSKKKRPNSARPLTNKTPSKKKLKVSKK